MTDHVWCHGPSCHKRSTTSRIRGSKGSKVLRTIKIAVNGYRANTMWKYFCDQTCLMDFIREHVEEFARLHPRREALETPIEVTKETHTYNHGYGDRHYTTTEIKPIDNNEQIG
tara:strand:+ start:307 stop:648 length:342 start_codon:yes stop_codon:yes gene_type:complete